jgi:hypothetical protein
VAASWVLAIAESHPNLESRAHAINALSRFFSKGREGEFLASTISSETRQRVVEALWKAAYGDDATLRRSAMAAMAIGRAHHDGDSVLLDAFKHIYDEREKYDSDTRSYVEIMWRQDGDEQRKNKP